MTGEEKRKISDSVIKYGLLQFRGYNDFLIDSLKKNSIVFGSRRNFNDPFDCNLPINLQCSIVDIENLLLDISFEQGKFDLPYIRKRADDLYSDIYGFKRFFEENIYNHRRFSCFTIASNKKHLSNTKFWANYANKHQGICMKFNGELPFNYYRNGELVDFIPIEYCSNDQIPEGNYIKDKLFRDKLLAQYFLGTKSNEWKDEEEIRLAYFSEAAILEDYISYEFDPKYLEEVYIGCKITDDELKVIIECLSVKKYDHVDVYRLEMDDKKFKLNRKLIRQGDKN